MKTTLRDVLQGIPATVVGGLRLGARDALVRRVFLSAGAVGCALAALELLTPGRAAALTGASESGAVLYAVIACLGFVSSGVGSHLAPLTARLAGSGQRAVMVSLGAGAAAPSENELLHRRVPSAGRATALSVQSLALQLVAALSGLVVGVLPAGPLPWLLGGTALLAGAVLWIQRDPSTPSRTANSTNSVQVVWERAS
ncbi:hypothetical protein ACGFNZ_48775 [Streptomyces mirabilis]|uniref:hypothetical protein n=1 Tax=Streptomyces mirabilis TaxID=68239 RepID=UPI0037122104